MQAFNREDVVGHQFGVNPLIKADVVISPLTYTVTNKGAKKVFSGEIPQKIFDFHKLLPLQQGAAEWC